MQDKLNHRIYIILSARYFYIKNMLYLKKIITVFGRWFSINPSLAILIAFTTIRFSFSFSSESNSVSLFFPVRISKSLHSSFFYWSYYYYLPCSFYFVLCNSIIFFVLFYVLLWIHFRYIYPSKIWIPRKRIQLYLIFSALLFTTDIQHVIFCMFVIHSETR